VLPGFTVEVLPSIDSSNTELMRRLRGTGSTPPQPEPVLLVAEAQTAGRGRLGRSWQSRRGDSLTFSLSLPLQPVNWSGLSLVVGISLAESLDPVAAGGTPRIRLKWPNDVWLAAPDGDRKLAGILVETTSGAGLRHAVVGIGINIRAPDVPPPADPAAVMPSVPPGALQALCGDADAAHTLMTVVPPLVQAIQAFEQFGFAPFQARFAARDALAGRAVQLSDGTAGTAHGVSENGALLVHTPAGMKEITSSEVSVRPTSAEQGSTPC
jgi:BirA family transcriptional regulator, biotin operon repressor / biotin---[acetyl-CoA-carboxylase] ligase